MYSNIKILNIQEMFVFVFDDFMLSNILFFIHIILINNNY